MTTKTELGGLLRAVLAGRRATQQRSFKELLQRLRGQHDPALLDLTARACGPFDFSGITIVPPRMVDELFREWARENGVTILRRLQEGKTGQDLCAYVYLAIDTDGIVKVFKELIVRRGVSEAEILQCVQGIRGVPRFYSTVDVVSGLTFLRMEMCYGQNLSDWIQNKQALPDQQVRHIVRRLAEILDALHRRGIIYLDLKPENVRVNGTEVTLIDFNACILMTVPDATLVDPRYAAPETTLLQTAMWQSDVFALGVMYHQLLCEGRHPFAVSEEVSEDDLEARIIQYALPAALTQFRPRGVLTLPQFQSARHTISRMLHKDPTKRPSMKEVAVLLKGEEVEVVSTPRISTRVRERNTVLFPARMGIPHKGHIEFIARLLELGYFVRVSIQHSYIITRDDPYPKWLVRKMVARSLLARGFSPQDFEIVLSPMVATMQEMRMHFAMMPGHENVVAVATGNPDVFALFPRLPLITQQAVFGIEGEEYEMRSWGERLRRAVREGDRHTFLELAAPGVVEILSFEQLQAQDTAVPIDFVSGQVRVVLEGVDRHLMRARIRRYENPEEALVRACRELGHALTLIDPYARDTVALLNGRFVFLRYESMRMEGEDLVILYRVIPNSISATPGV